MKTKKKYVPDRGKKQNNGGFSLVEVLVTMIILAIIVTPIMHSFVTTMNTNGKARKTERATAAARNVMEGMRSMSVEDLTAEIKKTEGTSNSVGSIDDATGVITYYDDVAVDGTTFYAKIVLDGTVAKVDSGGSIVVDESKITRYNESRIKTLYDLDDAKDAIYIQERGGSETQQNGTTVNHRGLDEQMASRFAVLTGSTSTNGTNEEVVMKGLCRTISINVQQVPVTVNVNGTSTNKVRQMVSINYTYQYGGRTKYAYTQDRCIYDGTYDENDPLKKGSLENIYLFFEPMYNHHTAKSQNPRPLGTLDNSVIDKTEVIEIKNPNHVPVNVHLIRMEKANVENTAKNEYAVTVKVDEDRAESDLMKDGKAVPCTRIRTNMGDSEMVLRYRKQNDLWSRDGKIRVAADDLEVKKLLDLKGVNDASVAGENVYKMTVSLYESKGDRNDNKNALFTMEGTKER